MRSLLVLCLLSATAIADPVGLAVDGKDIYVDLGAREGVGAGARLELLHEITAKDPRTGAVLRDHFALGTLVVDRAGDGVAVAHADDALAKRVMAGDGVRLVSAKKRYVDPWAEQVAASKTAFAIAHGGTPSVDHAGLVRTAWQETLGLSTEQRIARWQQLLAADPDTPYRKAIDGEIMSMRDQIAQREAALAAAKAASPEDRRPRISELVAALAAGAEPIIAPAIDRALPDQPIALAFLTRGPIEHAWLFARPAGAVGYTRSELARDGDAYLRGAIAPGLVTGDTVEWYVASAGQGAVIGSPDAPMTIAIDKPVAEPPPQPNRSHVDLHVDYVDFDGKLGKGFDQYYEAEADFTYRFLQPVYAVQLGFGTLSGTGGPKDVINADPIHCLDDSGTYRCRHVTFSYVYTEFEFELRHAVHLMLRPQVGQLTTDTMPGSDGSRCQGRDISGCELLTGFGGRARLRLGGELGTNLVIGASFTKHVGTLLEAAYHWLPAQTVPVQIMVQVTDEPIPQDFGVRLIGDVGVRRFGWFFPSVRVSYQARDIHHSGISGGMAMNFDW
jgi:hypothetical protein